MPLDTACLLAVILEGIVYGFSILMFMGTIWSLTYKQRMQDINRPMLAVAILLLILSTGHIVANVIRMEDGLVKYRGTYPGGPVAYLADPTQKTLAIMHVFYVLQTLLADGVVIYRCYVVSQSVWVIIIPSLLWCSVAVTGFGAVYSYLQVANYSGDLFANLLGWPAKWVTAFFASTMATNGLSSGLLAYRIWMVERKVSTARGPNGNSMMPIVRVLVDAAILYTVVLVITLILFLCSNNVEELALEMIPSIISIAFYMVLIRIAINRQNRTPSTNETELSTFHQSRMQVDISKYTRNDGTPVYGIGNEDQPSTLKE
ncbi:hypothetical protein DEU56DRAFT_865191 [Suillus clintonianus]|uniref:uncharacterized protein n=1 Tax=Suillus clintonianus TaxID=1904413 RepID=UPI001B85E3E9|nr:uncharacterized protein DEU56DRAFT_865191 [Suillus clintonianus]KAG2120369.1 hypothetical protein DEU56DRAFT_865191 [Suillus clintonianus]